MINRPEMKHKFVVFVLVCLTIIFSTSDAKKSPEAEEDHCEDECARQLNINHPGAPGYTGLINPLDGKCYCYSDDRTHLLPMIGSSRREDRFQAKFPLSMVPAGDCTSGSGRKSSGSVKKELADLKPEVAACITRCRGHYYLNGGAGICIESKCYCYRIGYRPPRDGFGNWETIPGSQYREFFAKFERKVPLYVTR